MAMIPETALAPAAPILEMPTDTGVAHRSAARVLVIAFSCHPDHGSELGMAWNLIKRLSQRVAKLVVVTPEYRDNRVRIEQEVRRWNLNVQFHFLPLGGTAAFHRWPINYLLYNHWHSKAARIVDALLQSEEFDVVHLLNTVGYRLCGRSHAVARKRNVDYVWGPIDGGTLFPITRAWKYIGIQGAGYYAFYNLCNYFQFRFSTKFRKALRNSRHVIAATSDMQALLQQTYGLQSVRIPEVGCTVNDPPPACSNQDRLELSWSGLHIHRKALPVLFHALHRLPPNQRERIRVHILGAGPLTRHWQTLAERLDVAGQLIWHGWLPKDKAREIVRETQIFCQTSFREVTSTVVVEALSLGVPVLSLRCCGMKDLLDDRMGWLIDMDSDIDGRIAEILSTALASPEVLRQKSEAALETARQNTWDRLADRIISLYPSAPVQGNLK